MRQLALELLARGAADRLDRLPARADEDALLGVGLRPDGGAHERQPVGALLDLLDLDLDGVRHLLAGAPQHLLAHELGEHAPPRSGRCAPRAGSRTGPRAAGPRGARRAVAMPVPRRADTGKISSATPRSAAAWSTGTTARLPRRSILLTAITTGTFAPASASAMKRSPGPMPCSPLIDEQRGVGLRQLALDRVLHALGERVARALHARAGRRAPSGARGRWPRRGSRGGWSAACRRRSPPWRRRWR